MSPAESCRCVFIDDTPFVTTPDGCPEHPTAAGVICDQPGRPIAVPCLATYCQYQDLLERMLPAYEDREEFQSLKREVQLLREHHYRLLRLDKGIQVLRARLMSSEHGIRRDQVLRWLTEAGI